MLVLVVPVGIIHVVFQVVFVGISLEADRAGQALFGHVHPGDMGLHVGHEPGGVATPSARKQLLASLWLHRFQNVIRLTCKIRERITFRNSGWSASAMQFQLLTTCPKQK